MEDLDRIEPRLKKGNIVFNKRYTYRGAIVHIDQSFKNDENWYLTNQGQDSKQKPWYFLLVNKKQQVTYIAEENLEHCLSGKLIVHSMINLFFYRYDGESNR